MKHGRKIFRGVFAVGLLAGLIYFVGGAEMLAVLSRLELPYVAALIFLSFVLIFVSCIKWRLFIRACGHDAGIIQLMKIYTITYFYNMFAPSMLVGDVARSFQLGKQLSNQKDAFVSTFLERLTGLLAMVLLGTAWVAFGAHATEGLEYAILAVSFLAVLASTICFSETAFSFATSLVLRTIPLVGLGKHLPRLEKIFREVSKGVAFARTNELLFAKAMFWSVVFHFGTVVNTYTAALAVGWKNPDFGGLCIAVPMVLLVSLAPVTPSGIGITEGAFLYFLQRVGATRPEALGVGLVLRAKTILTALVGWALWASMKNSEPDQAPPLDGDVPIRPARTASR